MIQEGEEDYESPLFPQTPFHLNTEFVSIIMMHSVSQRKG